MTYLTEKITDESITDNQPSEINRNETPEIMGPREFIHTLETLAQMDIAYCAATEELFLKRSMFEITDQSMAFGYEPKDSIIHKQWQLTQNVLKKLEKSDINSKTKEFVKKTISSIEDAIIEKNKLLIFVNDASNFPEEIKMLNPREKNQYIAKYLLESFYPGIASIENINYGFSPYGLLFFLQNTEDITTIKNYINNTSDADDSRNLNKQVGGFFSQLSYEGTDENNTHTLGLIFLKQESHTDTKVSVSKTEYDHEEAHLKSLLLFKNLDGSRKEHLTQRNFPMKWQKILEHLTQQDLDHIKSEIFAFETNPDHRSSSPYITLTTDTLYDYGNIFKNDSVEQKNLKNFVNKLLEKIKLKENESEQLYTNYKDFIRHSTVQFQTLQVFYEASFKDKTYARKMTEAVLTPFPIEDWSSVVKGIFHYSQYQEYNIEHDKFVKEMEEKFGKK